MNHSIDLWVRGLKVKKIYVLILIEHTHFVQVYEKWSWNLHFREVGKSILSHCRQMVNAVCYGTGQMLHVICIFHTVTKLY
jgi:hypothetical protein